MSVTSINAHQAKILAKILESMAAFKSKFKNLLRLSDQKGFADEHLEGDITETQQLQQHAAAAKKENPADLAEIIAQIHENYYNEDKDCCQFELLELDKECTMPILESRIMDLKRQEMAARKKVSDLVLANYIDYVQELQRVAELQLSLQNTVSVCVNGRRSLTMARQGVSHGGLGVLAKHRKRQRLNSVLLTLRTLKTLQMTDVRLQEMLKEGNYAGATRLCLECLTAIPQYKQYTCISDLGSKLKDTQNVIEHQLEEVLATMCTSFNPRQYHQVQIAYRLLGKSQSAIDQLLMHFTSTIHSNAFSVVFEYAKQSSSTTENVDQKVPYRDLCKVVPSNLFTTCLKSLCKAMWKIMRNYYQIKAWHENVGKKEEEDEVVLSEDELDNDENLFNKTYVKQKLELGLSRIWQDVQQKVKPFLVSANMAHFAYDNMMKVLDTINRLISLGIEFCGKGSDSLQESIRQQSLNYFKTYHRNRLDELRAFLENEAWEICPVRASFTFYSLREFHFMKNLHVADVSEASSVGEEVGGRFDGDIDPFTDEDFDEDAEEIMESSQGAEVPSDDEHHWEDEENEDLHKDYVDELAEDSLKVTSKRYPRLISTTSTTTQRGPVLSNTTLTVLRLFGNYMQMMHVLKPIASDVLECLTQLFDYYLYAIFTFFATDPDESSEKDLSGKMKSTLKRIREKLIFNPQEPTRDEGVKVPSPTVYELLNLDDPKTLYGLSPRLVATESLVFLAKQFESLQSYCEKCIPETRRGFLQQYFSQTVNNVDELRKPVYSQVSKKAINYGQMSALMATVKWDIKDIMSQHSQYVDSLLKEFADFADQISKIQKEVAIPQQAYDILWEMAIKMANKTFVEGFSQAKKCSNEGRALMQLDYQQFLSKLGKLTELRPIPDHDYVETYIKAYYLTEGDMEKWIQEHREYTPRQVTSLVMCGVGAHLNRKARQKLLAVISDDTNK